MPNQRVCEPIYPAYDLLADDTVLCAGQELLLDLNGIADAIRWEDSTTIKTRTIDSAGIYYYSYGNCPPGIAESIKVTFEDCRCNVYIPNAFSPNNDGVNDVFMPFYSCTEISDFHMMVYDRWGAVVFESTDADFGWNGTFSGTPCEPGLYMYTLAYRDNLTIDNELVKMEGEVSLLK
jgi:gliding motility-associated-like protein